MNQVRALVSKKKKRLRCGGEDEEGTAGLAVALVEEGLAAPAGFFAAPLICTRYIVPRLRICLFVGIAPPWFDGRWEVWFRWSMSWRSGGGGF